MISAAELRKLRERFPKEEAHGSSDSLSWYEGLPESTGPILYSDGSELRAEKELRHTAVFGASGMGKSRSYLTPAIIASGKRRHNMIIADCKGELYDSTAGFLTSLGYEVCVLNFADPCRSNGISLFKTAYELIRSESPNDVALGKGLLMDIANILCPVTTKNDPTWESTAATMIYALTFILITECKSHEEITFKRIFELKNEMKDDDGTISYYEMMLKDDPDISSVLKVFNRSAKTTQSCYFVIMEQALVRFALNKALQTVLSTDEISPEKFLEDRKALYIIFPDENTTYSPLTSSVVKMIYECLIREARRAPGKTLERRVHFLLDEFSQMPLVDFPSAISAARSRNIMFTLVMQSYSQLVDKFGKPAAETILNNCAVWIYLGGSDVDIVDKILQFSTGMSREKLLYLDRRSGEAVVREANKPPYISKLVDISRYRFEAVDPPELPVTKIEKSDKPSDSQKDEANDVQEDECASPYALTELDLLFEDRSPLNLIEKISDRLRLKSVLDLHDAIRESMQFDCVTQKELADLMKWAAYDPEEELENIIGNSKSGCGDDLDYEALIDFICAFSAMDREYRMFDQMLYNDAEWERLKEVMVSGRWSPDEAEDMRARLRKSAKADVKADFPDGYIGSCLDDGTFRIMIEEGFRKRYGKAPRFDAEAARRLLRMTQMDYDAEGFLSMLFDFAEKRRMDLEPRHAALSVIPYPREIMETLDGFCFSFSWGDGEPPESILYRTSHSSASDSNE